MWNGSIRPWHDGQDCSEALEKAFRRGFYSDEEDATARARLLRDALQKARQGEERSVLQTEELREKQALSPSEYD